MARAGSLLWFVAGAMLLGAATRFPVPILIWLALPVLLHASRSVPALQAIPCVGLAL